MVELLILHIVSPRRTFDQSFIKIFQRVQEIWNRQESVTDGVWWTDEDYFFYPVSASRRGVKNNIMCFTNPNGPLRVNFVCVCGGGGGGGGGGAGGVARGDVYKALFHP